MVEEEKKALIEERIEDLPRFFEKRYLLRK